MPLFWLGAFAGSGRHYYEDEEYEDENEGQQHTDEREEQDPDVKQTLLLEAHEGETAAMLEQMNSMRLDCVLVDVTFQVKDKRFAAHRLVMSCCSRWLAALLYEHENDDVVQLDELDPGAFECVMAHTYGEPLEVRALQLHPHSNPSSTTKI